MLIIKSELVHYEEEITHLVTAHYRNVEETVQEVMDDLHEHADWGCDVCRMLLADWPEGNDD